MLFVKVATCDYLLYRLKLILKVEEAVFLNISYVDVFVKYLEDVYGGRPIYGVSSEVAGTPTITQPSQASGGRLRSARDVVIAMSAMGLILILLLAWKVGINNPRTNDC